MAAMVMCGGLVVVVVYGSCDRDAGHGPRCATVRGLANGVASLQHLLDRRLDLADQERLALHLVQPLGRDQVLRPQQPGRAARRSVPGTRIFLNRFSTSPVFFGIGFR